MTDGSDFWAAERDPTNPQPEASTALQDLVDRVARLEVQVQGLYTASAAYAQIARGDTENARAEARSDMERVRTDLTELIDRLVVMVREVSPPDAAPPLFDAVPSLDDAPSLDVRK